MTENKANPSFPVIIEMDRYSRADNQSRSIRRPACLVPRTYTDVSLSFQLFIATFDSFSHRRSLPRVWLGKSRKRIDNLKLENLEIRREVKILTEVKSNELPVMRKYYALSRDCVGKIRSKSEHAGT